MSMLACLQGLGDLNGRGPQRSSDEPASSQERHGGSGTHSAVLCDVCCALCSAVCSPSAGCHKVVKGWLDKALVLLQYTCHVTPTVLQHTRHTYNTTHAHANISVKLGALKSTVRAAHPPHFEDWALCKVQCQMHTTEDTCCSSSCWQQWLGSRSARQDKLQLLHRVASGCSKAGRARQHTSAGGIVQLHE
jgi:hypothetical protein